MRPRLAAAAAALVAAAAVLAAAPAWAQPYPSKVVRIIIGFPPGGSVDIAARVMAAKLSERVGQSVIVESRSGAAGIVGMDAVAKAAPDGYTLGLVPSGTITITPNLRNDMPFNPLTDLAPVAMAVSYPLILVAHPSFPAKNMAELIALAKARPGKLTFGSPGTGTTMHLAGVQLNLMAGIDVVHAPYKGASPVANDLVAGHIPIAFIDVPTTREFIRQGRLKVLGTTGAKRALEVPDVPTIAESGVPGYAVTAWQAVLAPARVPPDIVRFLSGHIVEILQMPDVRERYLALGLEPAPSTPEELGSIIRTESARWAKLIKDFRITAQ